MAASSSDPDARRQAWSCDDAVSEVIGFLLTFAIISFILLVSMLAFNDAQQRAEGRLIEIQGASAAQRVAAASVDLALFVSDHPYNTSVAIDLPTELQGISYSVKVCQTGAQCGDGATWCATHACPYVKTESFRGDPQYQSTFLLAGKRFCDNGYNAAGGGIVLLTYYPDISSGPGPDDCIGLRDETV